MGPAEAFEAAAISKINSRGKHLPTSIDHVHKTRYVNLGVQTVLDPSHTVNRPHSRGCADHKSRLSHTTVLRLERRADHIRQQQVHFRTLD